MLPSDLPRCFSAARLLLPNLPPMVVAGELLLRSNSNLNGWQVATLSINEEPSGFVVAVRWVELATTNSIFPNSPTLYNFYLTKEAVENIQVTRYDLLPPKLKEPPSLELWIDLNDLHVEDAT